MKGLQSDDAEMQLQSTDYTVVCVFLLSRPWHIDFFVRKMPKKEIEDDVSMISKMHISFSVLFRSG
jgi:hypothetical protein